MKYFIDYGTGAGNEWVSGTLADAKAVADDGAAYTQCGICIIGEDGEAVAGRPWIGRAFDPEADPDTDPIYFGSFGYFGDWDDVS